MTGAASTVYMKNISSDATLVSQHASDSCKGDTDQQPRSSKGSPASTMSRADLESGVDRILARLWGPPQTPEVINLSREVDILKSKLTATCPNIPEEPETADPNAWDLYEKGLSALAEHKRQQCFARAELESLEALFEEAWARFMKVLAQRNARRDAHDLGERQQDERVSEGASQQHGQEPDEEGRGWSLSVVSLSPAPTSVEPETDSPPVGARPGAISFEKVWNKGNPTDMIIQSKNEGYCVLRCSLGRCSVRNRPFMSFKAAGAHLRQAHRKETGHQFAISNADTFKAIGSLVQDCDKTLLEKNNKAFQSSCETPALGRRVGRPPKLNADGSRKIRRWERRTANAPQEPIIELPDTRKRRLSKDEIPGRKRARHARPAVNIKPGQVYCHGKPGARCSAAVILPIFQEWSGKRSEVLKTAEESGFFAEETNAKEPVPPCIDYDEEENIARGWTSEYRGEKMSGRQYPAVLFTGPEYPRNTVLRWVEVEHLSTYNEFFINRQQNEHLGVKDYLRQMEKAEAEDRETEHNTDSGVVDAPDHQPSTPSSNVATPQPLSATTNGVIRELDGLANAGLTENLPGPSHATEKGPVTTEDDEQPGPGDVNREDGGGGRDGNARQMPIETIGQPSHLGERFATPKDTAHEPTSTASHDAFEEPAHHPPAENLPETGEEENRANQEGLPGRLDADQEVSEGAAGEGPPGTPVHSRTAPRGYATLEMSSAATRTTTPELADQARFVTPPKQPAVAQNDKISAQETELARSSDALQEAERAKTALETQQAYRAVARTGRFAAGPQQLQPGISTTKGEGEYSSSWTPAAVNCQPSTNGGTQLRPLLPPMDLSSWHGTSRAATKGSATGIIPGSTPSETGSLRAHQTYEVYTSPSDLRSVASRCLQYRHSSPVQANSYSHMRMGNSHESNARWSAECPRPGNPSTFCAPVAYMGDGPGEEATMSYAIPRPSLEETSPSNSNFLLPAGSSGTQSGFPASGTVRRKSRPVVSGEILPKRGPAGHMPQSTAL